MRKTFLTLCRKEMAELGNAFPPAFVIFALLFQASLSQELDLGGIGPLLAAAGALTGFAQAYRDSRGDMWAFALHRPVSSQQMFAAKFAVGATMLLIIFGVPYAGAMWWLSVPGHVPEPFDRSYWLPGIADYLASLPWYAAGLYAGSRRQGYLVRGIGFGLAFAGTIVAGAAHSIATTALCSVAFTGLLTIAAWSNWESGSDFDAQPLAGRAANVIGAIPSVAFLFLGVTGAAGFVSQTITGRVPAGGPPPRQQAAVTRDGGIVMIKPGEVRNGIDHDVIMSNALATDERNASAALGDSYRDPKAQVGRLFERVEGPTRWFYQASEGLIGIYDQRTGALTGWVGPDGASAGTAIPTRRFSGRLQMKLDRPHRLLVLSNAVYSLADRMRPKLVFTAPEGEIILQASEGLQTGGMAPRENAPWGWFTAVTTTARTYVLDKSGVVEPSVAHPTADAGKSVAVFRVPYLEGSPTFLWYSARTGTGDTLTHVLEFRRGSAGPVAEYRFAADRYSQQSGGGDGSAAEPSVVISGGFGLVPVVQVYSLVREKAGVERANAIRTVLMSVVICLVLAVFTYWLGRRFAYSRGRTITWAGITTLIGPVALVVMWLFLEPPARE